MPATVFSDLFRIGSNDGSMSSSMFSRITTFPREIASSIVGISLSLVGSKITTFDLSISRSMFFTQLFACI